MATGGAIAGGQFFKVNQSEPKSAAVQAEPSPMPRATPHEARGRSRAVCVPQWVEVGDVDVDIGGNPSAEEAEEAEASIS